MMILPFGPRFFRLYPKMELLRRQYLDRLRRLPGAPAITAVTGIRRAGESVLLRRFAAALLGAAAGNAERKGADA